MFNVGGGELLVIFIVALVVLGPDKLPGAVRSAGRVLGEVRRVAGGFQDEVRRAMHDAEPPTRVPLRRPDPATPAEPDVDPGPTPTADAADPAPADPAPADTGSGTPPPGPGEGTGPPSR
jgi:sec-independent protein translocase protein TatB